MTGERLVLFAGLAFIASALLMLGTIIARSPYTHDNLLPTLSSDYDRTLVDAVDEAKLEAILVELRELPRLPRSAPDDRRLAINTASLLASDVKPTGAEASAFGKALYTQKCSSCHTIGEDRRVGPDLMGITGQRSRDWLIEFISAPDRVRAQGDPIATQLVRMYGVPMPNLDVSRVQAEAVLAFIEARSEAVSSLQTMPPAAPGVGPVGQDTSRGQALFQQRCASCHTIGGGKSLGPDLMGISALRPRDWLIEFTVAPDRVRDQGDPIATQSVQEYGMPMPNLGVTAEQVEEILAYIDHQSGMAPAPAAPAKVVPTPTATVETRPAPTATAAPTPPPTPTKEEPTASPPAPAAGVSFAEDVLPVLQRSCAACHGTMGGWSAASFSDVMNTGEHKPNVVPGDPDGSALVQRLKGTQTIGESMPPGASLPADIIQKIVEWVKAGAKDN